MMLINEKKPPHEKCPRCGAELVYDHTLKHMRRYFCETFGCRIQSGFIVWTDDIRALGLD